jgi:hypothetical protein
MVEAISLGLPFAWERAMRFASMSICEDVRDKIYGIQSAMRPELRIDVDYSLSAEELFMKIMMHWTYKLETQHFFLGCLNLARGMGLSIVITNKESYQELEKSSDEYWILRESRAPTDNMNMLSRFCEEYGIRSPSSPANDQSP